MIADQLVRDEVLDISQSFLVQAPAGSGKTSLLVQRFLCLLANVQQAPEEIVALTFTRKAAAEMRDRIIGALELGLQAEPKDNAYQYKLWLLAQPVLARDTQEAWDLIANPSRLKIQTIDALCSSITTQMPIISQFGAQPQIEARPQMLYQKAIDQLLQESASTEPWQQQLNILLGHLDNDRVRVKKLLALMLAKRDQWIATVLENFSQQATRQILEYSLQLTVENALLAVEQSIPPVLDFSLLPIQRPATLADWLLITNILLTKDGAWRAKVTTKEGFKAPDPKTMTKQECEQLKANKQAMHTMLENLNSYETLRHNLNAITKLPPTSYSEQQWQILDALSTVLKILVAQLIIVFKDSGQLDFAAVSLAALHALGADGCATDLALALDCKLRHILVDEFQDTSIIQFQILEKLTANWDPYDARTLFLVGDPMQSIYRFRKAEVALFLKAKQYGINKIPLKFACLTVNFRSSPQIVAWVNKIFKASFPDADDITYGAISYMPAQAANASDLQQASCEAVDCNLADAASEAQFIVDTIQNIRDNTPNRTIAILVRAKSHLAKILPALRANNIPYHGIELETLKQRSLIQDLLALTKAILHLDDRIAWLAILRAPWCGLLLKDLNILARSDQTIWQTLQQLEVWAELSDDAKIRVARFNSVMSSILAQRGRQAIDLQVQTAWQALGGNYLLANSNDKQEVDTYINLLSKLASKREIFSPQFLEQDLNYLYSQTTANDHNPVQIMTMHKAKGLEFDVVMLPGLGHRTRSDTAELLLIERRNIPHDYLLIAPIKSATEQHDPIYKYLAWNEAQRQTFEELRLLYVATTRARHKIYCLADKSILKSWPAIASEFVNTLSTANSSPHNNQAIPERIIKRLPTNWYSANQYNALQVKTLEPKLDFYQQDWLRVVGKVVHRILQRIASDGIENCNQQQILAEKIVWQQQLRQEGVTKDHYAPALKLIEQALINTFSDPFAAKILSNNYPESYVEWRLTVREYDDFKQVILDRAFVDDTGQFWIVDYKIIHDAAELGSAVVQYTSQINKYIKAIKDLRPGIKINAGLYFPLQTHWHAVY